MSSHLCHIRPDDSAAVWAIRVTAVLAAGSGSERPPPGARRVHTLGASGIVGGEPLRNEPSREAIRLCSWLTTNASGVRREACGRSDLSDTEVTLHTDPVICHRGLQSSCSRKLK